MSIRLGLERAFPDRGRDEIWHYGDIIDHRALSRVMSAHKPLAMLRDHFPEELAQLRNCTAFAVTRDPVARFASAVQQYLREFRKLDIGKLSPAQLSAMMTEIRQGVESGRPDHDVEFIHFTRQIDYVELDGETIVQNVYPIENLSGLASGMEATTGRKFDFTQRSNVSTARVTPNPVMLVAGKFVKRLVPPSRYEKLKRKALSVVSKRPDPSKLDSILSEEMREFVESHYRDDFLLHSNSMSKP